MIVSHPGRVANKPEVSLLMCATKPATRPAEPHEVILDASDGLDLAGHFCRCDLSFFMVKKCRI